MLEKGGERRRAMITFWHSSKFAVINEEYEKRRMRKMGKRFLMEMRVQS